MVFTDNYKLVFDSKKGHIASSPMSCTDAPTVTCLYQSETAGKGALRMLTGTYTPTLCGGLYVRPAMSYTSNYQISLNRTSIMPVTLWRGRPWGIQTE